MNRRQALIGTVAPPVQPPQAMAETSTARNATDKIWHALEQATHEVEKAKSALERHDAALPPEARLSEVREAILAGHALSTSAAAEYARRRGAEAMRLEEAVSDAVDRECALEHQLIECEAVSPIDVERKLATLKAHIQADEDDWSMKVIRRAQADLRRLAGFPSEPR